MEYNKGRDRTPIKSVAVFPVVTAVGMDKGDNIGQAAGDEKIHKKRKQNKIGGGKQVKVKDGVANLLGGYTGSDTYSCCLCRRKRRIINQGKGEVDQRIKVILKTRIRVQ